MAINIPWTLIFWIAPIIAAIINHNNYLLNQKRQRFIFLSTIFIYEGCKISWQPLDFKTALKCWFPTPFWDFLFLILYIHKHMNKVRSLLKFLSYYVIFVILCLEPVKPHEYHEISSTTHIGKVTHTSRFFQNQAFSHFCIL